MSIVIEKLIVVQEQDCRIRQMEKELKDIPARKTEEIARLDGAIDSFVSPAVAEAVRAKVKG